jgi:tetratricopeptide (TPR) repeat protein
MTDTKHDAVRRGRGPSPAENDAKDGAELMAAGDYEGALRAFDDALALDPKHGYSLYGAAFSLSKILEASPEDLRGRRLPALIDRLLDVTPPNAYWEGVADEDLPRKAVIFALGTRAAHRLASAKGPKDLNAALKAVEKSIAMMRPTDDAEPAQKLRDRVLGAIKGS